MNCESWRIFCHQFLHANADLTPHVLMAGKPVEAVEGVAFKSKAGHVENEPWIMSPTSRRKPCAEPAASIVIILLTI
jgi:hypothetical protein